MRSEWLHVDVIQSVNFRMFSEWSEPMKEAAELSKYHKSRKFCKSASFYDYSKGKGTFALSHFELKQLNVL